MEVCPFCMRQSSGKFCAFCGGEIAFKGKENQLPVGTKLKSASGVLYQFGASSGKGGFGVTYAALDCATGRKVAIKEYFPIFWSERSGNGRDVCPKNGCRELYEKGRRDFLNEANTLVALRYFSSIVKVMDFFQANNTAYIVMEYLEGETLAHQLTQKGRFTWQKLQPMLKPLLEDIQVMHVLDVLHRDIAPDNIMVMRDGRLKLMDFGSARNYQKAPDGKTILIKPGFSPVEQYFREGEQGSFTDVYAMAATIVYCLSGEKPVAAPERLSEITNKGIDPLKDLREMGVTVPDYVQKALRRALAIKSAERTQSMQEFCDQLYPASPMGTSLKFLSIHPSLNGGVVDLRWQGSRPHGTSFYLLRCINNGKYHRIGKTNGKACSDRLPIISESVKYRLELRDEAGTVLESCESRLIELNRKPTDLQQHLGLILLGCTALVLLVLLLIVLCIG